MNNWKKVLSAGRTARRIAACYAMLILVFWIGGYLTAKARADCPAQTGYGANAGCRAGAECGTCLGVTAMWCTYESCTQSYGPRCPSQYVGMTTNTSCVVLGCLDPVAGNCNHGYCD